MRSSKETCPGAFGLRWAAGFLLAASLAGAAESRRVLIVDIDGVRGDTFAETYASGRLPNFARVLRSAVWFDKARAVVPTVTMAGQPSIFTGRPPERHGIPGNQWFSRAEARMYEYTSSGVQPCLFSMTLLGGAECRGGLLNRHIEAPTLYEAATEKGLRSIVSFHPIWRGATRGLVPSIADGLAWLSGGGIEFEDFDRTMAARAAAAVEDGGVPDILTVYFAGVDEIGHADGIVSQPSYLSRVVDPSLGRILDALEGQEPDWLGSAMVIVTADHGRSDAVANPEDRTLARDLLAAVSRAGVSDENVKLATNGGMAYLYLHSGGGWEEAPAAEAVAAVRTEILADPLLNGVLERVTPRGEGISNRWGDLSVFLKPGHYFGNTGVGSHHGNLDERDLWVPLVVARADLQAGHTDLAASITQVAATVARFLGFEIEGVDPPLEFPPASEQASRNSTQRKSTLPALHLLR